MIGTFNMIIMRTAFQSVPISLEESAKIDGANDLIILFRIIIPLSMPVIAVMILWYAVGHWNSYFGALIYLRTGSYFRSSSCSGNSHNQYDRQHDDGGLGRPDGDRGHH